MSKLVDIYIPLDSRATANREVWPVAVRQLVELIRVIKKCGWKANVLNPDRPVASVAEGMRVVRRANGQRFLNFMAGWAYPDFSVSPMANSRPASPSCSSEAPSAISREAWVCSPPPPEPPRWGSEPTGCSSNTSKTTKNMRPPWTTFSTGGITVLPPRTIDVLVAEKHRQKARRIKAALRGSIYGAVGPAPCRCGTKSPRRISCGISDRPEGFDGLRLAKMAEKVSDKRAERALDFLLHKGMDVRFGPNPKKHLTREMVIFQMKVYFALLELKERFGLDFVGVQDSWTGSNTTRNRPHPGNPQQQAPARVRRDDRGRGHGSR